MRRIVHDEIGSMLSTLYPRVEDVHNMRMQQASNPPCLRAESVHVNGCQSCMEDLNSDLGAQLQMLTQVHLREASFSQKLHKTVVSDLLASSIRHCYTSRVNWV